MSGTGDLTDPKFGTDQNHPLHSIPPRSCTETLGPITGQLTNNIKIVQFGLKRRQLFALTCHTRMQLEKVTDQLPHLFSLHILQQRGWNEPFQPKIPSKKRK